MFCIHLFIHLSFNNNYPLTYQQTLKEHSHNATPAGSHRHRPRINDTIMTHWRWFHETNCRLQANYKLVGSNSRTPTLITGFSDLQQLICLVCHTLGRPAGLSAAGCILIWSGDTKLWFPITLQTIRAFLGAVVKLKAAYALTQGNPVVCNMWIPSYSCLALLLQQVCTWRKVQVQIHCGGRGTSSDVLELVEEEEELCGETSSAVSAPVDSSAWVAMAHAKQCAGLATAVSAVSAIILVLRVKK